jgi:hypothetical protein
LGAVLASGTQHKPKVAPEYKDFVLPAYQSNSSAVGIYWGILGVLVFFVLTLGVPGMAGATEGVWVVIMGFPLIQLVASLLAMLAVLCFCRVNMLAKVWVIAIITFGTFVGTMAGVVLMMILCGVSPAGLFN